MSQNITQNLVVSGMHCASCTFAINKKVSGLEGVETCEVNYATEEAKVSFDPQKVDLNQMNQVVAPLGYSLSEKTEDKLQPQNENHNHGSNQENHMDHSEHLGLNQNEKQKQEELTKLKNQVEFAMPIAVFVFLAMLWQILEKVFSWMPVFPIPMEIFDRFGLILATLILVFCGKIFVDRVFRFLKFRVANMDTLVGIGTLVAYSYSAILLLFVPFPALFTFFTKFKRMKKQQSLTSSICTQVKIQRLVNTLAGKFTTFILKKSH